MPTDIFCDRATWSATVATRRIKKPKMKEYWVAPLSSNWSLQILRRDQRPHIRSVYVTLVYTMADSMMGVYYAKVKGIVHGFTTSVIQSLCPLSGTLSEGKKPSLTMFKRDCVFWKCPYCGIKLVKDIVMNENPEISYETEVIYEQWKMLRCPISKLGKLPRSFIVLLKWHL